MRNIAICGQKIRNSISGSNFIDTIEMNNVPVFCGLVHSENIEFNPNAPENRFKVLVKKKAFSCNYRDKALIFKMMNFGLDDSFYVVGSDFVGEVVNLGSEVINFQIGDKVIGNNAYPYSSTSGSLPGIPSNHGSKEYQVLHQEKLVKVPHDMPDDVAAAFSIGGQTSYSVVRKLNPTPGSNILVTAAKSNTSLFVISALKKYNVNIFATTTSLLFEEELRAMGIKEVILLESKNNKLTENKFIREFVEKNGGFDCVFDPFFDLYLEEAVQIMAFNAKYITCGLYDQYFELINQDPHLSSLDFNRIMNIAMVKNLQIIGNCLGDKEDLENAIQDYSTGKLNIPIDSVFTGNQVKSFFERTYNAKDRFGKVVYKYD
ncbi:zinc-binding alcohol dehydrogenase family protein [Aetokthonos hydrillicola Thurmond2011]|uniref:Zinc-binding alcohol dehydrogenase family protein n=1 Tax=Aetokthonos hydrillicola Thurmond2011 TaxID=2712845 RepID=A0AAP5MAN5_9CYAN|nr:zinc-binding alcohol dehydrogenase family protein [Aetokthonos hydrillicola]MDR9897032.1 zinc-binding alcohol dehydrogenase family protein [Aetokthonos hydrillicola Thurmond2011]